MRRRFIACESCSRHVRAGDVACPFCGAVAPTVLPVERTFGRGLSRATMYAAGTAGFVVAMVHCGKTQSTPSAFTDGGTAGDTGSGAVADASDEPDGNVGGAIFYGVACGGGSCDSSTDTDTPLDASTESASFDA